MLFTAGSQSEEIFQPEKEKEIVSKLGSNLHNTGKDVKREEKMNQIIMKKFFVCSNFCSQQYFPSIKAFRSTWNWLCGGALFFVLSFEILLVVVVVFIIFFLSVTRLLLFISLMNRNKKWKTFESWLSWNSL